MVLSNKKLKQKLRSTLAETLTAKLDEKAPTESTKVDTNLQVQSLKVLLDSAGKKPRLSKREKRRKDLPFKITLEGNNDNSQKENKVESGLEESTNNKEKKKKKRKREEVGEGQEKENVVSESTEKKPVNKKKKKKKKRKLKKQKISKDDDKVVEINGEEKEEPVKIDESQETAEISTKVYVGGIPYYSTEDDIRSFFESCGTITELECISFPDTGKFRGISMITFKTDAAAKRALALDGADMGGLFLKIQPYKTVTTSRPQKSLSADFAPKIVEGYNRVYVGNLSWDITEDDLKQLFSDCKISSVRFGTDKETGEFLGYAHVDFEDSLSLAIALKLDQKEVCGRPARISCAVPKKEVKTGSKSSGPQRKNVENETLNPIIKVVGSENSNLKSQEKVENESTKSGGKKRRTCYECGVAGHISTDCPKKKQEVGHINNEKDENETLNPIIMEVGNESSNLTSEEKVENESSNTLSSSKSGKKRRTCYECGVAGHISTDCPKKKQAVEHVNNVNIENERSNSLGNENLENQSINPIVEEKVMNESNNTVTTTKSSGGKKR